MTLVPVNSTLALLEVHRIARQVPVDHAVAPGMEIEPSCPIDVLVSTKGRNGLLNVARTASWLM